MGFQTSDGSYLQQNRVRYHELTYPSFVTQVGIQIKRTKKDLLILFLQRKRRVSKKSKPYSEK
ncbi:MAG: hypothetical protein MRJ93_00290 [Nitrososphaeraceae archaeon]|nr:hypothetical protein [Nitrososphaeraceae archaeon]